MLFTVAFGVLFLFSFESVALADSNYYHHTIFDNSLTPDFYFYSGGQVSPPSKLQLDHGKLPVETRIFLSPPNALRLAWTSSSNGGWDAQIQVQELRDRQGKFKGTDLFLWCYSHEGISSSALPFVSVIDKDSQFSERRKLSDFSGDIPAGKWVQLKIPLSAFETASLYPLDPNGVREIVFSQGEADGGSHVLILDEIKIDSEETAATKAQSGSATKPAAPQNLQAKGNERHIDLTWQAAADPGLQYFRVERSNDGGTFAPIGIQVPGIYRYTDFLGQVGRKAEYRVVAVDKNYRESPPSVSASASTRAMTDDELLTMLQGACFRYYW